jgi:hypothetical protein
VAHVHREAHTHGLNWNPQRTEGGGNSSVPSDVPGAEDMVDGIIPPRKACGSDIARPVSWQGLVPAAQYLTAQMCSTEAPDSAAGGRAVACVDLFGTSGPLPDGKGCEEELFTRRGRPVLFSAHDGVAYGVSANPNDNSTLYLWADNRTTQTVRVLTCCAETLFEHIYVFDSLGQRVLSKADHRLSTGERMVKVCTCSPAFSIPQHTIQLVDAAEISREYVLKSGSYTISERFPPVSDSASNTRNPSPEQGLRIAIGSP